MSDEKQVEITPGSLWRRMYATNPNGGPTLAVVWRYEYGIVSFTTIYGEAEWSRYTFSESVFRRTYVPSGEES